MNLGDAKAIARNWVAEHAESMPGFRGAFIHGSANWLPDDAILAPTSDLDVMIVLSGHEPAQKLGKLVYHGLTLEISYLSAAQFASPDRVLGNYHLAGSFKSASAISDPFGDLGRIQMGVAKNYARRQWVEARCDDASSNLLRHLDSFDHAAPFHQQVTSWLFATGVTTHILLVAGLENPTVRTRYLAARELLARYDDLSFYDRLLRELGCRDLSAARALVHLDNLGPLFDHAARIASTPFPYLADISPAGRAIAIDGSRELITQGNHREAIFWIVATYARCLTILAEDGTPADLERYGYAFRALLADLGIQSTTDLSNRNQATRKFLPEVRAHAQRIIASNPDIIG